MRKKICRWGILSTASIAKKNWQAIRLAENATLTAVASRDQAKADQFIADCQAHVPFAERPAAIGSYDALLANDAVDAVYIPLPTGLRKEWVIRAAAAGKHVICEKPCAISVGDLREMLEACRKNKIQFMDGVMFMHSQRLAALRETIDDGRSIGNLKRIATQFSFRAPAEFLQGNIRTSGKLEPAGCVGDLGWYNIRFSLFAMNYALPKQVTGRLLTEHKRPDSPVSVPLEFSGELFFDGGSSASFYCSFVTEHQQWANVSGDKGHLHVSDFVLPLFGNLAEFEVFQPLYTMTDCDFNMERQSRRVSVSEYSNSHPTAQETNMIRNFSANVLSGKIDQQWPEVAMKTQQVLDACLQSARQGSVLVDLP